MVLQEFLDEIATELNMNPVPKINAEKTVSFPIGQELIEIQDLQPGVSFRSLLCPCPEKRKEELFLKLTKANYLGQETGPTRIGLSRDEKSLTLSLGIPYELTYRAFREHLEDFVNFTLHWRKEIKTFETLETLL